MPTGLFGYLTMAISISIAMAMVCLGLTGCASTAEKPDIAMQELVLMFPGHYDNTAQVEADIAHGVQPPHEAVVLDIVPIEAIMIGENVFYVQESVAGDPKRVLGQKVVMFGVVKKEIVQTDYSLNEPYRWRNGQLNPDLFKALMVQDVHSNKGCSLRWKRSEGHFVGANDPLKKYLHAPPGRLGPYEARSDNLRVVENKEIARAMVLAEDTVKKGVQQLIAKLGATDRTHAVVIALRTDLIQ